MAGRRARSGQVGVRDRGGQRRYHLQMSYQLSIGAATVTILTIAEAVRSSEEVAALYPAVDPAKVAAAIDAAPRLGAPAGSTMWAYNLLLIQLGNHTILADTGFSFRARPGSSAANAGLPATATLLRDAGVAPSEIDSVVLTHAHGDHYGGLLDEDEPAFKTLVANGVELDYWTGSEGRAARPESAKVVEQIVDAYRSRLTRIAPGDEIISNASGRVVSIDAPGHTPGHIGLSIESKGESLWAMVDLLHAPFQFAHPRWGVKFDTDAELAARTRVELLGRAAEEKRLVHFYHLAHRGLGRVERGGDAYRFLPLEAEKA